MDFVKDSILSVLALMYEGDSLDLRNMRGEAMPAMPLLHHLSTSLNMFLFVSCVEYVSDMGTLCCAHH